MLTKRQRDYLDAIVRLTDEHGRCPSYREIAAALGTSVNSTHRMVQALVERGYVTVDDMRKRSIWVIGRERVFVVCKGEDGDAVLVEWPAPGQKRPASGRDGVGPSGDSGSDGKGLQAPPLPAPLLDLMETT